MGKDRPRHVERRLDRASFRLATLLKAAGAVPFLKRAWEHNGDQSPEDSSQQFQDLDKLMDRMEEAARDGSRKEAAAMLDQMQDMFED